MRQLKLGALRLAVLGVPVAVASVAFGTGAASASTTAPATGVTWHQLSAINGWHSAQQKYNTGNPRWAVKGGVVYLSGSVDQVASNDVLVAVLPKAARPARAFDTHMYTSNDTNGWLDIFPGGDLEVNSAPYSNAQSFTSLAEISYPAAGATTHALRLLNGWRATRNAVDGAPSYTVKSGMVYLTGAMHRPTDSAARFAVLPRAARPAHVEYITIGTWNGVQGSGSQVGTLEVFPSGVMKVYGPSAEVWLGNVAFPQATTTRHDLTLLNGWVSGQSAWNSGDPAYWVSGGVVHLSGSLIQPSAGQEHFATLPAAARPKHSLYIKVYTYQGSVGTLFIQPNGTMQAYGPGTTNAQKFTSLAAVSFPVGS